MPKPNLIAYWKNYEVKIRKFASKNQTHHLTKVIFSKFQQFFPSIYSRLRGYNTYALGYIGSKLLCSKFLTLVWYNTIYVAGGFWAIIFTCPARLRCWASVWSRSKHVVVDKACALNRQYSMGLACDIPDHRAGAC